MSTLAESRGFRLGVLLIGLLFVAASLYSSVLAAGTTELSSSSDNVLTDGQVSISVPSSAVGSWSDHSLSSGDTDVTTDLPEGITAGSVSFELSILDADSAAVDESFSDSIAITITYNDSDVDAAEGNPARLSLYKYDSDFDKWFELNTKLDIINGTVSTNVTGAGSFSLGGKAAPAPSTPTPEATAEYKHPLWTPVHTPVPPATATEVVPPTATPLPPEPGDVAPTSGLLVGLMIIALTMMSAGGYYIRQTRVVK